MQITEIESSELTLACTGCADSVVLLGRKEDWYSEGRTNFTCSGCGEHLTLAQRIVETPEASNGR